MVVKCPAKKRGQRRVLEIPADLPFVDLIIEQVNRTLSGRKVWNFGKTTAIRIVKRAMGQKYYPHFFRLNRATQFLEDPETTIPQMMAWFGWRDAKSVNPYIGYTERYVKEMGNKLRREVKE